jgi:16S rRNA (guanine(966)-N(2))-methyltransferase RsmD
MRESVFAILHDRLPDSSFLDLFSGSGIIGLEAWSRGAREIVMVEKDRGKRQILSSNATLAEGGASIRIMSVERYLKFMAGGPFDFIFLDPPFPYRFKAQLLDMAAPRLAPDGELLIHHPKEDALCEKTESGLALSDRRVYGRSQVSFYKKT